MNTDYLTDRFQRMTASGLPLNYKYDGRMLSASSAAVYQKLKFSEWGVDSGYEQSILGQCKDFPGTGHPEKDGIIEVDGEEKRVLNFEIDAARVGVRIDLGPKWHAD